MLHKNQYAPRAALGKTEAIYIYGHSPSDHPDEFPDKGTALTYFTYYLPGENNFRYHTTYTHTDVKQIIFSFAGELLAELVVDEVISPTKDDMEQYDKTKKVYLINEIRIFRNQTYRLKDFGLKYAQSGKKITEDEYKQIIETVGGFKQIITKPELKPNRTRLNEYYQAFVGYVEQQSGEKFISFASNSYIKKEENYKYSIHEEALFYLGWRNWQQADIGSGEIIKKVIAAIEKPKDNNLVPHDSRHGQERRYHQSLYEAEAKGKLLEYEQLLYDFYHSEIEDAAAFKRFVRLAGKRYAYIAYLYFLKDKDNYLPIAPNTFDTAFEMVGIDFKTSHKCSWKNYQIYNRLIAEVKDFLETQVDSKVQLLDAHSFLWIIARHPTLELTELEINAEYQDYTPRAAPSVERVPSTQSGKIDYAEKQRRQMAIGQQAEYIVLSSEKKRLRKLGRADLAEEVENVGDKPWLGYDICSYEVSGEKRPIEVKAIRSEAGRKTFFLTQNELNTSKNLPNYHLYLVTELQSNQPKILVVKNPDFTDEAQFNLEVVNYSVSVE
jgi:hypothetical protein